MITGILFVLVLPRQPTGVERATLVVNRAVRLFFLALSRLAKTYEQKDAILAPSAPVALIAQLLFWAATLVLGLGLMLMPTTHSFPQGLLQALTSLFTVGARPRRWSREHGDRYRRRRLVGHHRGVANRLPPHALQRVQPTREPGGAAREPCRRAGLGTGTPRPPPTRRHHRHIARPLQGVGDVVRRRGRESQHVSLIH